MKSWKITEVGSCDEMERLEGVSALTFEGAVAEEGNLEFLEKWFKAVGQELPDEPEAFVIIGEGMNGLYGLTGSNSYPDDLSILMIDCIAMGVSQAAVAIPRFEIGGRWLDDVVENNRRRQEGLYGICEEETWA